MFYYFYIIIFIQLRCTEFIKKIVNNDLCSYCVTQLIYSQLLRIKRNCSSEEDYAKEALNLAERLKRRGYPSNTLQSALAEAKKVDRQSLLGSTKRAEEKTLTFVTTYDGINENVMRKSVQILLEDLKQSEPNVLLKLPDDIKARVAFRVDKALGDSVGKPFKQEDSKNEINQTCSYRAFLKPGERETKDDSNKLPM